MVAAAFASTSTTADGYSYLAPNPTGRDPVRRRTTPLVTATNRHVHGRTATSLPRDRFVNPPRPLFAAAATAEAGEMAAETSTGAKPFAVLFVCLGKSRESPYSIPSSERASVSADLSSVLECMHADL
jgi:protein-tyrosine phosphatase